MPDQEEVFDIVDEHGCVIGQASREACHRDPALRHRVVHVLVTDPSGRLFLQLRAAAKDIQPGKWDTSVGGHVLPGENARDGACRELAEELGIRGVELEHLYHYTHSNAIESEWVDTFRLCWDGPVCPDPLEIETGRWWVIDDIRAALASGIFTPNFAEEFNRWQAWLQQPSAGSGNEQCAAKAKGDFRAA